MCPRWRGVARDRLGKNRGIGAATARVLGQADARVMLADISGRQVEQTAATLAGEGYDIAWQTIDLSDESTAKALLNAMVARFGRLDILDNNAASQRSEEHTSELQSLMRNSYAVFCLKKTKKRTNN